MRIDRVSYKKIFPIAAYVNETIGVEVIVNEGESAESALKLADKAVNEWYAKEHPYYNSVSSSDRGEVYNPTSDAQKIVYKTEISPEINIQDERKQISIENARTIEELATLKKDLPSNLMPSYMDKLKELTAQIK